MKVDRCVEFHFINLASHDGKYLATCATRSFYLFVNIQVSNVCNGSCTTFDQSFTSLNVL